MNFDLTYQELEQLFSKLQINTSQPEFYNQPNFIQQEKLDPNFLMLYALFVNRRKYTEQYLKKARQEIPLIAESLFQQLKLDGRLGACIDISGALCKILEKEGFWCYCTGGSFTINFPKNANLNSHFFYTFDSQNNEFTHAHAWVVAPPFAVIDLSISRQPNFSVKELNFFPPFIITENSSPAQAIIDDLVSPLDRILNPNRIRPNQYYNHNHKTCTKLFPPFRVETPTGINFKYIPLAIAMPSGDLETFAAIKFGHKYSIEVYLEDIVPKLKELRANP